MTAVLAVILLLWLLRAANVALSVALIPRLAPAPPRNPGAPFVSIVVPARNEERDVDGATRSKCAQDDPSFEVVVVDDRSSDGTRRILAGLEREFPSLRVVDGVEPPADGLVKPHALHEGARAARAAQPHDWLVFSDADVYFEPDLLARSLAHARRHRLEFLALLPTLEAKTFGEKVMVSTVPAAAFCYFPGWLMNVPSARRFGGGGGIFNLIRRDLFDRIGGHEALRASVVDDIQLGRNARLGGGRTAIAIATDSVRVRMYHGFGEIVKGLEKNAYFAMLGNLPMALLVLPLFFLEGELPFAVLLGGALERLVGHVSAPIGGAAATAPLLAGHGAPSAFFTFEEILLSSLVIVLTLLVRGAVDLRLRLGLFSTLLHPLWVAALSWIFGRSAWINGVLHRNEWRGRVRDSRNLRV